MQTFKFDLRLQVTAIVPEEFLQAIITEASGQGDKEPTVFLKKLHDEFTDSQLGDSGVTYDEACDTLTAAVLTNALRKAMQAQTSMFLVSSGLGCRVSPVEVLSLDTVQPRTDSTQHKPYENIGKDATEKLAGKVLSLDQASIQHELNPEGTTTARISQGAAVQALQDTRREHPPCKGAECGTTCGNHSEACVAEHEAACKGE